MFQTSDLRFDAATGLSLGARDEQQDAVLADMPQGGAAGLLVLADGLGGHAAGATASRIAVSTALAELAAQRDNTGEIQGDIPALLTDAALAANHAILAHAEHAPETTGMGTTLVIAVLQQGRLYWLSVGDSPLFLVRDGDVLQLNEVHSLAAQLDLLARAGEISYADAAAHPDRNCLTAALGEGAIQQIDCPSTPLQLRAGDVLVLASDGILTLAPSMIGTAVRRDGSATSADLAADLVEKVAQAALPTQDNLSIALVQARSDDLSAHTLDPTASFASHGAPHGAPSSPGIAARQLWSHVRALWPLAAKPERAK